MPHYDYHCSNCNHKTEIFQKMLDTPLNTCPQCGQSSFQRKFGKGAGLQFQGSGFYSTDYETKSISSPEKEKGSPSSQNGCGCSKKSCDK